MIIWNFVLIIILVAINGFFVAVEFAAVTARRVRIQAMASKGNRSAEIVKSWLENRETRDRLIAAAQLGITIVSLALGAVGENTFEALLEPLFHDLVLPSTLQSIRPVLSALPLVISLIIVTSLHVVVGEQVPKVAALNSPEAVAILGARPMQLFSKLFKWFVDILDWATRQILKILGLQAVGGHTPVYSVDELKQIVSESEHGGILETPAREMLYAIFDFSELLVRQVMVPRTEVEAIEVNTTLEDSVVIATESSYTKFPVYEKDLDHILGIVHIKELLRAGQDPDVGSHPLRSLVRDAIFVPETITIRHLLEEFRSKRQHIAIVMDEFSGTAGLVTLEDIMEEIVGEVSDPFDANPPQILKMEDGTAQVDGLVLIDEVNESMDLTLRDPHYDTIAGYILGKLGRMAEVNDAIEVAGYRMQVTEMDGLRISKLLMKPLSERVADDSLDEH